MTIVKMARLASHRKSIVCLAAGIGASALLHQGLVPPVSAQQREPGVDTQIGQVASNRVDDVWPVIEMPVRDGNIATLVTAGDGDPRSPENCPQFTATHTSHQFTSGGFTAQAGFVGQEIAAVTYTIDPVQFPIRIDRVDGLFGTQNPQPPITVHWSMLVWAGEPTNGTLVYVITSDGVNPPHMVLTQQVPQPNAIYLQAMVDPSDPEQIIVNNNGSNKFTVGFRIDQMNQVPSSNCNFGCTPAHCCPHPPSTNLFPTTDLDGLQQASNNWIFVPQGCGPCVLGAGWWRFSQLGANTPSGDWIIRAIYTPTTCPAPTGACCLANGACVGEVTATQCTAQSGSFQGPGSQCSTTNCPVPTGACCLGNGNCLADHTQAQCTSAGGTFMGAGSECGVNLCRGACCVPSTQQCVFTTPNNCASVSGTFHGFGSSCQTVACFGACCLPNGSCVGGVSPASCSSQGGVFQGANTTCGGVNCPPPLGACCVGTACLKDVSESDCTIGFGGVWMGAQSACAPNNPCVATPCPADISPQPNGDGVVNVNDLLMVINSWGQCPPAPASCPADISPQPNGDGVVNVNDLLMVINSWGPCPN